MNIKEYTMASTHFMKLDLPWYQNLTKWTSVINRDAKSESKDGKGNAALYLIRGTPGVSGGLNLQKQ